MSNKPIEAWAVKNGRGYIPTGTVSCAKHESARHVNKHINAKLIPITITEGHGALPDQLEKIYWKLCDSLNDGVCDLGDWITELRGNDDWANEGGG